MLFKTRSGLTPQTPKLASIGLPDDNSSHRPVFAMFSSKSRGLERRAVTPAPERPPSRALDVSLSSSRTRTVSLTSMSTSAKAPLKSILKSSKTESTPLPYDNYSHSAAKVAPKHSRDYADPTQHRSYASTPFVFPASYDSRNNYRAEDGKPGAGPVIKSYSDPTHDRRPSHERAKDIQVTKAPMKEESIALSWPLVDFSRRRRSRTPSLYFDIAFDPRIHLNVRVDRGGVRTNMSEVEKEIPVSSHCLMTKMTIICPPLATWPIKVRQREGITCFEVFCAIYDTFNEPLTPEELGIIPKVFFDEKFWKCFHLRCKESPGLEKYNIRKGPRRVDLLKGRRIFQGIERSGVDWELTIDRL